MTAYQRALQELARAAPKDFVAERRRLAAALRAVDKGDAARLELRRKPTASVWAVNQLYWRARDEFFRLLATAASLRKGDIDARRAHRDALGALHQSAVRLLREAGLGAADATLRRVDTSLAAIAAAGGFDPEPDGALEKDLEAPGFAAMAVPAPAVVRGAPAPASAPAKKKGAAADRASRKDSAADARARRREEVARVRTEKAEQKRRQREIAERAARRGRCEHELEQATRDAEKARHAVAAQQDKLRDAELHAHAADSTVEKLRRRLAALE